MPEPQGECGTCAEFGEGEMPEPWERCPESKRPCGHHCNCTWIHDICDWCGAQFCETCESFHIPKKEPCQWHSEETAPTPLCG